MLWSTLSAGSLPFDPVGDILEFDGGLSAADIKLTFVPGVSTTFSDGVKSVTLLTGPETLTTANVVFQDGSELEVGDNLVAATNDSAANTIIGGSGDDLLAGLGGNDSIDGSGGNDTAVFAGSSGGYSLGAINGQLVVTDTDLGNGNDGADTLSSVEQVSFADGGLTFRIHGEHAVNTTTFSTQNDAAVAVLADGGYVVTWKDEGAGEVKFQRYDAEGDVVGGETLVSAGNSQADPVVAPLTDGGFVIAWHAFDFDNEIFARRYDENGTPGSVFQVNTTTAGNQQEVGVAALPGDGFVVTWLTFDGTDWQVHGRLYDSLGAVGSEFAVSQAHASNSVQAPSVVALAGGGFVVGWLSTDENFDNQIYARRFDAGGNPLGAEFQADTADGFPVSSPSICALPGGGFLLTWTVSEASFEIYGQRYSANGDAAGAAFHVNTTTSGAQEDSSAAALADGGFVVVWSSSGQDGSGTGVFGQRYDASGAAAGTEFRVNSTTASDQSSPSVAALPGGGFIVTWQSNLQDGSGLGIYAQRFDELGNALAVEITGDGSGNVIAWAGGTAYLNGGAGSDTLAGGAANDHYIVDSSADVVVEAASAGIDVVESSASFALPDNVEHLTLTGSAAINGAGNGLSNVLTGNSGNNSLDGGGGQDTLEGGGGTDTLAGGGGNDLYLVDSTDDVVSEAGAAGIDTVRAAADYTLAPNIEHLTLVGSADLGVGNASSNVISGSAGNDELAGLAGNDTLDGGAGDDTAVFSGASAGYAFGMVGTNIVVSDIDPGNGDEGVDTLLGIEHASFADGVVHLVPRGEQRVNAETEQNELMPVVAGLSGGGYVITWSEFGGLGDNLIYAQRFAANGAAAGEQFVVSDSAAFSTQIAAVAATSDGGFVIAWNMTTDEEEVGFLNGIYARRYDAAGTPLGAPFSVSAPSTISQDNVSVAALPGNGFLAAWQSGLGDVFAQRFDAGGAAGAQFRVNTSTSNTQGAPAVAASADGSFVIAWESFNQDALNTTGIYAQRYAAGGAPLGGEFRVNTTTANEQGTPAVAVLGDGSFVITWRSIGQDGPTSSGVFAQLYDSTGAAVGGEFLVNTTTAQAQIVPAVTALGDGGFLITWQSNLQDGSGFGIYGQRYDAAGVRIGGEFQIHTTTADSQTNAAVAATADGGFVVTWETNLEGGTGAGVYAQRYDDRGNPVVAELTGDDSSNAISWSGGPVTLDGGAGADTLAGGAGNSLYIVDDTADVVVEGLSGGYDRVQSSATFSLASNVEELTLTGNGAIHGTGNSSANLVTGNSAGNSLNGGGGADTLDGGGGADTLAGGAGADVYLVDSAGDVITEAASVDIDTVRSSVDYTLSPNVENLVLLGNADAGTGNSAANSITGGSGGDELAGLGGADTLRGGAGNDSLRGDGGNDLLDGGAGMDTAVYLNSSSGGYQFSQAGADIVVSDVVSGDGSDGNDTLLAIEAVAFGLDTITIDLSAGVELTGDGFGNRIAWSGSAAVSLGGAGGDDTLAGGNGADQLDGGAGADSMSGGAGNDHYLVDAAGDQISEAAAAGTDSVESSVTFALPANVEHLTLLGGAAIHGSGNNSNNVLTGNSAGNSLDGGAGTDTLDGAGGADTLSGGAGSDLYFVDSAGDTIVEAASQGTDSVQASVSHALADNVENLVLVGAAASGSGNALSNTISGNAAANTLSGGGGNDTLDGAGGADVASYAGAAAGYSINRVGTSVVITDIDAANGNDGVDTLIGVESAAFADGTIRIGWPGDFEVASSGQESSLAVLSDGGFMIAWSAGPLERAQRFDAAGSRVGEVIELGSLEQGSQVAAALGGGRAVVLAQAGAELVANIYDPQGALEQQLQVAASGSAGAVTGLADGGFAVAWMGAGGVLARRFDADGIPSGVVQANSGAGSAFFPLIAPWADGGFVVAWETLGQEESYGVYGQLFDAVGDPFGGEFRINVETEGDQSFADLAPLADGGFIATWTSGGQDGSATGVYARRFGEEGLALGQEFRVATTTEGMQYRPTATGLADGGFVIAWQGDSGLFFQRYDAFDRPIGGETAAGSGALADIAALPDGGFLLSWSSGSGIRAQRFDPSGNAVATELSGDAGHNVLTWTGGSNVALAGGAGNDTLSGGAGNDFLSGGAGSDTLAGGAGDDTYVFDADTLVEAPAAGVDTVRSAQSTALGEHFENLVLTGAGAIDGSGNGADNFILGNAAGNSLSGGAGNDTLNGAGGKDTLAGGAGDDLYIVEQSLDLDLVVEAAGQGTDTVYSSAGFFALSANVEHLVLLDGAVGGTGNALANLIAGNGADNFFTGGAGNDTLDGGGQENPDGDTALGYGASAGYRFGLQAGGIVLTDVDPGNGNTGADLLIGIEAVSFADGTVRLSGQGETQVNTHTADGQFLSSVAALNDGGYVVVWQSNVQDGDGLGIYAQRFDSLGVARGAEFHVSTFTDGGAQSNPAVAPLLDGGYLIAWQDVEVAGSFFAPGIRAQRYDADGEKVGATFQVNATVENAQLDPAVVGLPDGGFLVSWRSAPSGFSSPAGVYARRYNADGQPLAEEFAVHGASGDQSPAVAALADGGFVVAWTNGSAVLAQRYDDTGAEYGSEFTVDTAAGAQDATAVAALADGGFVITWISEQASVGARRYDANGDAVGGELAVSGPSSPFQGGLAVSGLAGGGFVVAWVSDELDLVLRRYDPSGAPLGAEYQALAPAGRDMPALAALPDGGFVLTWHSIGGDRDGSASGVYLQRFDAAGNPSAVQLVGDAGANAITWTDAANAIIEGGAGDDTLQGGAGDDYLVGGEGVDVASYSLAAGGVDADLAVGVSGPAGSDTLVEFEHLVGSAFGDRLAGDAAANSLTGAGGDDTLVAGAGADTLDGGAGTDVADFSAFAGPLAADLGAGGALGFTLVSIEGLIGTDAADTLTGDGQDNVLDGRGGADTLAGGAGNDRYVVDSVLDQVGELSGVDQIDSSVSLALPDGVENLLLTADGAISGTGNALHNVITGNGAPNTLDGGAGNDTLAGGGGADLFLVNAGLDRIADLSSGDAIRVAGLAPVLPLTAGNGASVGANQVQVLQGEGVTTLYFGLDGTPGAELSVELGGAFAPEDFRLDGGDIIRNRAPQVAAALLDQEAFQGGAFAYTFAADAFADPDGDAFTYAAARADGSALPAWLQFNAGSRTFSGTPSAADAGILDVRVTASDGEAGAEDTFTLTVTLVNDSMVGTNADDTLDGEAGADTMAGLAGDDTYLVDNAGDVVVEQSLQGDDLVRASASYVLPDHVEDLQLLGGADIDGTGNGLLNEIEGNAGANRLDGGGSIDILRGGAGNDTYVVDNDDDSIQELADEGIDAIESSVSYALPANVEHITLTGGDAINAIGNALANAMSGNSGANSLSGGAGDDSLSGGAGNDTLDGGAGNDTMAGGAGDDQYFVDSAGDVVSELPGEGANDVVHSSVTRTLGANQEHLFLIGDGAVDGTGNSQSNQIFGNGAGNVLSGLDGDDLLDGEGGADTLIGGQGNDLYYVDHASDVVVETEGGGSADQVFASIDFVLPEHVERVTVVDVNALFIVGNGLNNFFQGADGDDQFLGAGGNDTLDAGAGDNTVDGGDGNDLVLLSGRLSDYQVSILSPGSDPRAAYDPGFGLQAGDIVNLANQDGRIDRLVGVERVRFLGNPDTPDDDVEIALTPTGLLATATLVHGEEYLADISASGALVGGSGNDVLDGLDGADTLEGLAGHDVLLGGEEGDYLGGGDGNDALDGQAGDDTLVGGDGNDTYFVDSALDLIIETPGMGSADRVHAQLGSFSLAALPEIEHLIATLDTGFHGSGNAGANRLLGWTGADTLDGGAGADTLEGWTGNDYYVVDQAADVVVELSDAGSDTVGTTLDTFTLSALPNVENLEYLGDGVFHGFGNDRNNRLSGGEGDDTLEGGAGNDMLVLAGTRDEYAFARFTGEVHVRTLATGATDVLRSIERVRFGDGDERLLSLADLLANTPSVLADTLSGGAGDDYFDGLAGNDRISGGAGNDTLIGGAGRDTLRGGAGDDRYELDRVDDLVSEAAAAGSDTVVLTLPAKGSYVLPVNVEDLELGGNANVNGTGNALANRITGNAGNNVLSGAGGNDTYVGSAGDDSYALAGAGDSIDGSAGDDGVDTARISTHTGVAGSFLDISDRAWLENVVYVGTQKVTISGNDAANSLAGAALADTLVGGLGDDTLNGGAGSDVMQGGAGNDSYVVNATGDVVVDSGGDSGDTLHINRSVDLGVSFADIEHVRLTGSASLKATGDGGDNRLVGNAAANTLDGGAGDDTLEGGAGNDRYVVDSAGDVVLETLVGGGTDTVFASVDFDLAGTQVEHARLTAGAGELTGNALANRLTGAGGNDTLDGGAGRDTLSGGAGDDRYRLDRTSDVVTEGLAAGSDTVVLTLAGPGSYTLGANVEHLELGGNANVNGSGNGLANRLTGNAGHNSLSGAAGDDTLAGGTGNDTLAGGGGNDTAVFSGARADYTVTELAPGVIVVNGADGADRISGVELVAFGEAPAIDLAALLAPAPASVPAFALDALLSGSYWQHAPGQTLELGFSFMAAAPLYGSAGEQSTFSALTPDQADAVRGVLALYETLLDVDFVELADADEGVDLRFGRNEQSEGSAAYAYLPGDIGEPALPGDNQAAGDVWISTSQPAVAAELQPGGGFWATLVHEIGHALGLKHPFDSPSLADAGHGEQENDRFTVMSYTARPDALVVELTGDEFAWSALAYQLAPDTPMLYDVASLQALYGPSSASSAGDDVYALPADRPFFLTLWDAGGEDTLDASAFASDSVIDLRAGHFSSIGPAGFSDDGVWLDAVPDWYSGAAPTYDGANVAIAFGALIEHARGGAGHDQLTGNEAANVLAGGAGNDTLDGGAGNDRFVLDSLAGVDTIVAFGADDLLALDNSVFLQLGADGALAAAAFRAGAGAKAGADASDRVIFDTTGGGLYYDADGAGGAASTKIAQLDDFGTVSAADILVV